MKTKKVVLTALAILVVGVGLTLFFFIPRGDIQESAQETQESQPAQPAQPAQGPAQPATPAQAPVEDPEIIPGRDYKELARPRRLDPEPADQVELVYVFWFGCGACRLMDPVISQYELSKPEGVRITRIPALYEPNEYWMTHGRLFYALDALGKERELHQAVFEAIQGREDSQDHSHAEGGLIDIASIVAFAESHGIAKADFMKAWDSPEVKAKMDDSLAFITAMRIDSTPSMAVNGRYSFSLTRKGTNFFLATAEFLAAKERARAGK
jgi:thiol:disulfide interchange protein DsbA